MANECLPPAEIFIIVGYSFKYISRAPSSVGSISSYDNYSNGNLTSFGLEVS
jgi:hypothetical protein